MRQYYGDTKRYQDLPGGVFGVVVLAIMSVIVALFPQAGHAITWDANSNNRGATVSSVTLSHTTTGTDRFLVCGYAVADATPQAVTTATYNGVAMTRLGTELAPDVFTFAGAFYLVGPATGTNNAVFSTAGGTNARMFAACTSYTGVHQTTPLGTLVSASGGSHASPISDNVTSASGELVVDVSVVYSSANQLGVGAGQTLRAEDFNSGNGDDIAMSDESGAATVTMSWDHGAATPTYAHFAVPMKPVGAVTGCRLLQDGTSKRLLQTGVDGRLLQGGGSCGITGGGATVVPVNMLMGVGL